MRMLYISLIVVLVVALVGCGGGGGGGTINPTTTVTINVPDGAAPEGITATVTYKTLEETPNTAGNYPIWVASVQCLPANTEFSQPVTLTFHLATAVEAGKDVGLFEHTDSGWTGIADSPVTLSADRKTATVQVSKFSSDGYYMLMTL